MSKERQEYKSRVLIADDDEQIMECYLEAFDRSEPNGAARVLDSLESELFHPATNTRKQQLFDVVSCSQGEMAVSLVEQAVQDGRPFDVAILDVRMPPGIDGVEAASRIRKLDPNIEIVFVSGYSDATIDELESRVPPLSRMHHFTKPVSFQELAEFVASFD
jgi:CheY-like chemotaxis protein